MPTQRDCEDEIIRASGGAINREEAARLLQRFSDRMASAKTDPLAMAREIGDEATAAVIIMKRNRLMNLRKRITETDLTERQYQSLKGRHGKQALYLALQSKLEDINTVVERGRDSAGSHAVTQSHKYLQGLWSDLNKLGVFESFRDNAAFQRDVGRELYQLSLANAGLPHVMGGTGNQHAYSAAVAIERWQALAKKELNDQGAWIGDYAGYVSRTTHDPLKMWKAGFEPWRNFILTKLDYGRTFEGVENPDLMLKNIYENLKTGIHTNTENAVGMKDPAFTGPGNLAKQLSQSRDLHFRDADSWLDYQERFGIGNYGEQIVRSLERSGRDWALMEKFGTNPRGEMENYIKRFEQRYVHQDPAAAQYLKENASSLMRMFDYLDGTADRPANQQAARIFQGIRNLQSMAKLGAVNFTHLFSMTTKIMEMRYQGVPWGQALSDTVASFGRGVEGRGDRKLLHDLLLSNIDGRMTQMMKYWTPGDIEPGWSSRMLGTMLKWEGFHYIMNSAKAGTKDTLARLLGSQVEREFDDLIPETQRAFLQHGITRSDWDLMRNAPDHTRVDGRTYLTPDAAHRAAPWHDANGNDLFTFEKRQDLAFKLYNYFETEADNSIVRPGLSEKAMFYQGTRPGTLLGEVSRFMAQFKMWGAANIRQNVGREWYGHEGSNSWLPSKSQAMGLISLASLSTILGYGRMATVSLLKGEVPRSPLDPATYGAALAQGGGLGIMGDLLFGGVARNQQTASELVLGPGIGTAINLAMLPHVMANAAVGDRRARKDLGPELLKTTLDNTPFINMFYTRTALNYLFLWRLQEWLNPGFQERRERRLKQQTGQTFWLSPAQHAH